MPLSWNEIKDRAVKFSKEWEATINENADAKPFLVEFFNVFGITSRKVGSFEHKVKKLDEKDGYIDLLWKGNILIEMKSRGKDLDKAFIQAKGYLHGLKQHELPKYILVSDFENFRLFDLEDDLTVEFKLNYFVNYVQHFGFIAGYQKRTYKEQDPVNINAALLMGKLHDKLKVIGYEGHPLEIYLVRLLFCLFADDTTIFDKDIFNDFIDQRTSEDGSDLAARLSELFYILNIPREKRLRNIDEQLNTFPYVNGKLFEETLPPASFDAEMRDLLLDCCGLNWGKISPAIFGSMFQSVMNPKERRNLGAHYTSEKNILKLIKPLFLDALWKEFESVKSIKGKLGEFHKKLSSLRFLDPACGCGNFLVITYRELRLLEIEILRAYNKSGTGFLDVREIIWLDVDMMYGIEYEEFPARIAEVAMWLIDHQMNMAISEEFGQYFVRLPLKKAASIVHGNALQVNWEEVISKNELCYILGNPPFVGAKNQSIQQRDDMKLVFSGVKNAGLLDYVCAWHIKAARYIQNTNIKVAFVSTNSISQGEQVNVIWNELLKNYGIKIHFAHRTFQWSSEGKGKAAVYCVIVGFAAFEAKDKFLYEYTDVKSDAHEMKVDRINPYLVNGSDIMLPNRSKPLCNIPSIGIGNKPIDGGNLLFEHDEMMEFIKKEPKARPYFYPWMGATEFLYGKKRWVLWVGNVAPVELRNMPKVLERIEAVKNFRLKSESKPTQKLADTPTRFHVENFPSREFLLIPKVTSERRKYSPIGFMTPDTICSDLVFISAGATLYHFGILSSLMHLTWFGYTCGRLEGRNRYSAKVVYNNFPWPINPTEAIVSRVEESAQNVLDVRAEFSDSTLADMYDPLTMPSKLVKAHQSLDKAVDLSYRSNAFTTDAKRMEYLFDLYEKYAAGLYNNKKEKTKVK